MVWTMFHLKSMREAENRACKIPWPPYSRKTSLRWVYGLSQYKCDLFLSTKANFNSGIEKQLIINNHFNTFMSRLSTSCYYAFIMQNKCNKSGEFYSQNWFETRAFSYCIRQLFEVRDFGYCTSQLFEIRGFW